MEHDAYCVIHDCYYDTYGYTPKYSTIETIHEKVPLNVKQLAAMWGWFDTEVCEKVCRFLEMIEND